jgi:hypothetical protein
MLYMLCRPGDTKYHGDYPELYSVAINSVLGTKGYTCDSHGPFQAHIKIVEKDSFGRTMFLYFENRRISPYSLIISQKNDGEYAYYYHDYNFVSTSIPASAFFTTMPDTLSGISFAIDPTASTLLNDALKHFCNEQIEKLKRKNDWNMDMDIDKCERTRIIRQKAEGPVRNSRVKSFYRKVLGSDAPSYAHTVFFTKDNYGRSMYVGYGQPRTNRIVVMFFQPDGSYDVNTGVMELIDLNNYQDDLRAFKERNSWNMVVVVTEN